MIRNDQAEVGYLKTIATTTTTTTPILRPLFRATWVSRYQKGKTSLDLNEARVG